MEWSVCLGWGCVPAGNRCNRVLKGTGIVLVGYRGGRWLESGAWLQVGGLCCWGVQNGKGLLGLGAGFGAGGDVEGGDYGWRRGGEGRSRDRGRQHALQGAELCGRVRHAREDVGLCVGPVCAAKRRAVSIAQGGSGT
jgi:hypothetical protein